MLAVTFAFAVSGLLACLLVGAYHWFVDRCNARNWVKQQFSEDTCATHGVWCCDKCFNMEIVKTVSVAGE